MGGAVGITMEERRWIKKTDSVCPVCMERVTADIAAYGDEVYMEKSCKKHGYFRTLIWKENPPYEEWKSPKIPSVPIHAATKVKKGCPYDCGLCTDHRQHTCCVLVEVTNQCNLNCPVCFAKAGEKPKNEPTLDEIGHYYDVMMKCGGPFNIQLSGGEPSLREDLEDIIQLGRKKGFAFFQLNTNGIRLAEEKNYAGKLKRAGLSCVFLQFDGLREETYEALRGRRLLQIKRKAIQNCREAGLGTVLVPVIAKGINDQEIGDILKFALEQLPAVRGVHFQPISLFGRYDKEKIKERFTLPELLQAIERQTEEMMKMVDFKPAGAENAYCSFSGNFMLREDGTVKAWHDQNSCSCGISKEEPIPVAKDAAKRAREFVAKHWSADTKSLERGCEAAGKCGCSEMENNTSSLDQFLERLDKYSLAVSAMAFMDAENLDLERLKDCYIHVVSGSEEVKLIPFCAYNLTATDGTQLYR